MNKRRFTRVIRAIGDGSAKHMAPVLSPLNQLVYSDLSVEEAAQRLKPILAAEPNAAAKVRRYVNRHRGDGGYVVYRGSQILNAATDQPPPEASQQKLERLDAERALGSKTLRRAFADLAEMVPALRDAEARTVALVDDPDRADAETRLRLSLLTHSLVGPDAEDRRPLVRSTLALMIASRYLSTIAGDQRFELDQPILGRPASIATGPPYRYNLIRPRCVFPRHLS